MTSLAFISAGAAGNVDELDYQGTWDAAANSPALNSGVGTKNNYYIVGTSGSTNLDSITDWVAGDWVIFNGVEWQKIDTTDAPANIVDLVANLPDPTTVLTGTLYQVVSDSVANNGEYQVTGTIGVNGTTLEKI